MWVLAWAPDSLLLWIVHAILVAGIIGSFLSFFLLHRIVRWFPALAPWHLLIQIVSIVLLVSGVYFKGSYDTEASWRAKVKEAEEKVAIAEAKSKETNTVIQTQYRDKVKTVKEVQIVVQERIVKEAVQMDSECKVDANAISILNQAAGGKK
jgi:hypothetical protein